MVNDVNLITQIESCYFIGAHGIENRTEWMPDKLYSNNNESRQRRTNSFWVIPKHLASACTPTRWRRGKNKYESKKNIKSYRSNRNAVTSCSVMVTESLKKWRKVPRPLSRLLAEDRGWLPSRPKSTVTKMYEHIRSRSENLKNLF